ncbi:MAG: acetoacetate decarboxylase family protein [Leptolyngbyaceae cyanobacterium bins.302]|nr:acetoacetate decarboxylase family protein [Leptolyngbyaceae cyanobacterium bins.302]
MTYPPAPWLIQGYGFLNLHLLDIERSRPLIPAEFSMIPVFPGKTAGGIFVTCYDGSDSVMQYSELIVVSGLVAHAGKIGFWVSHIYVDNPNSVAGGRDIWGLPKELAQFEWNLAGLPQVAVKQDDRPLCRLACQWRSFSLPLPTISAPVFSKLGADPLLFTAEGKFNVQVIGTALEIPEASPLAPLELGRGWLSCYSDRLSVVAGVPTKLV